MATLSDIVVYGDDTTPREHVLNLAKKISQAQRSWKERQIAEGDEPLDFHTFVLSGKTQTSLLSNSASNTYSRFFPDFRREVQ
jgi:hypothetical protein